MVHIYIIVSLNNNNNLAHKIIWIPGMLHVSYFQFPWDIDSVHESDFDFDVEGRPLVCVAGMGRVGHLMSEWLSGKRFW